jgi:flavin reductase (DIM6/NTAB) family NADH-FMN oxidoreductase RutF
MFKNGPFPALVVVVTTMHEGITNAAPITWFSPISYDPPLLVISVKKESDTSQNIIENEKFVVQTVPYFLAQKVHNMAKSYPRNVSELEEQGLEFVKETIISVPRLEQANDWFECDLNMWSSLGKDHYQFVGEVVNYKINNSITPFFNASLMHYGGLQYTRMIDDMIKVDPY